MCHQIGARFTMYQTLILEKIYHHLLSTSGQPRAIMDHLKHDLELWLNHHSFEELPDALEYYLVDPNSDLEADLTNLDLLDQRGVQVSSCLHCGLFLGIPVNRFFVDKMKASCRILGLTALNSPLQYVNWLVWEVCSVN